MVVTSVMFTVFAILAGLTYAKPAATLDPQPPRARMSLARDDAATPTVAALTGTPQATPNSGATLSPGPIIGLICVIVTSSVALGFAFSIRRRIDVIAGPDPDKEDD
jgi:hypothetical protein